MCRRWLLVSFAFVAALALVACGAKRRLVVPQEFGWIEFNTSLIDGTSGGNSIVVARRGERVRLETIGETPRPTRWYEGEFELSASELGRREQAGFPPVIFGLFERAAGRAQHWREVSLRGVPAVLALGRSAEGEVEALWIERATGRPLRFVMVRGEDFSWTEVFPIATSVADRLLEPGREGPGLRELYAAEIAQAKAQFAVVLREQTWKKDIEGAHALFPR